MVKTKTKTKTDMQLKRDIEEELDWDPRINAGVIAIHHAITLKTHTSLAQVKGHASSWQSIHDAASAAWATPGVTEVVDNLMISTSV